MSGPITTRWYGWIVGPAIMVGLIAAAAVVFGLMAACAMWMDTNNCHQRGDKVGHETRMQGSECQILVDDEWVPLHRWWREDRTYPQEQE